MDIARPELKAQKRRRQAVIATAVVLGVAAVSVGVMRLKPAAPTVERGTVWTDTVKRGPMLRQVRGLGSLVPSQEAVRQIPAETEATVVRIRMLPGSQVKADTILLEMSNPQTEQAAVDAELQLKAAEAEYQSLLVKLESDLMNQKAGAATVHADDAQAQRQADTDKALYELGVTAQITLGAQKYSEATQQLAFYEELERKLKALPGVGSVALSDSLPPGPPARTMPFVVLQAEGQPPLPAERGIGGVVGWRSVTPEYFSVLGIPLFRGRSFQEQDRAAGAHSIILNQALAQRLFPNEDAVGETVQFHADRDVLSAPFTVIGVSGNAQNQGLGGNPAPEYYMVRRHTENDVVFNYPDSQRITMIVRSAIAPLTVTQELRDAVSTLDPTLPVGTDTLGQSVAKLAERPRFSAALLSLFATAGLLLTALGIYGVVALLVSQRTQEIGIRVALGATPGDVTRMMVWQTSLWIGIGAALGILGSVAAARWIGSLLFGIRANDPATLAEAAALLLIVALLGAWVPARRAARIDPMVALRYE